MRKVQESHGGRKVEIRKRRKEENRRHEVVEN